MHFLRNVLIHGREVAIHDFIFFHVLIMIIIEIRRRILFSIHDMIDIRNISALQLELRSHLL